jgi:hypothetical protein
LKPTRDDKTKPSLKSPPSPNHNLDCNFKEIHSQDSKSIKLSDGNFNKENDYKSRGNKLHQISTIMKCFLSYTSLVKNISLKSMHRLYTGKHILISTKRMIINLEEILFQHGRMLLW